MRKLFFLLIICTFIACEKEEPDNNQMYSNWDLYDTIDGYVHFKINEFAIGENNEILFSSFVRRNWNHSGYCILSFSDGRISEYDTMKFAGFNKYINDSGEKTIWTNSIVTFIKIESSDKIFWDISDNKNKLQSSRSKVDSYGNIWIASENYYHSSTDGIEMYNGYNWNTYFKGTDFWAICFDKTGNLYVSTLPDFDEPGLILKYDYNKWDTIITCSEASKWVPTMSFDMENNLWIGVLYRGNVAPESGDGLYKFDGENITHFHMNNSELKSNSIVDIAIDNHNNKWIATYAGGLTKLSSTGKWKNFNPDNTPMTNISIESVVVDNNDYVWFDNDGLIRFKE
jgi:ligand-binding sensor domain-containing protein